MWRDIFRIIFSSKKTRCMIIPHMYNQSDGLVYLRMKHWVFLLGDFFSIASHVVIHTKLRQRDGRLTVVVFLSGKVKSDELRGFSGQEEIHDLNIDLYPP